MFLSEAAPPEILLQKTRTQPNLHQSPSFPVLRCCMAAAHSMMQLDVDFKAQMLAGVYNL